VQAAEQLERARQLVAGGVYSASAAEIAAVHAAIYPSRDAVCQTCPGELGKAFYAIQRWATQQDSFSSTSTSSTVKNQSVARFHSDDITYTPHGLGVVYSNTNLTDKAARYILKTDPDAIQHFAVLPPEAAEGEDEQLTATQQATETQVEKTEQQATAVPAQFDYAKLAAAMLDEVERRQADADAAASQARIDAAQQPALTASTGGAADGGQETDKTDTSDSTSDNVQDETKPVSLSRANKAQLTAFYVAEIGHAPAEDLNVDQLRGAIAEHRAAQQDPE
jgi:hypothetical protein